MSTFRSATFVQPGIGRAHLAGTRHAALNADTSYGPAFFVTALTATFFLIVSAIVLGTAIARTDRRLRWHGITYAVLIPAFAITGVAWQTAQPWTGFALAAATVALAVRLSRLSR